MVEGKNVTVDAVECYLICLGDKLSMVGRVLLAPDL